MPPVASETPWEPVIDRVIAADPDEPVFSLVLDKLFDGKKDENTMRILKEKGDI